MDVERLGWVGKEGERSRAFVCPQDGQSQDSSLCARNGRPHGSFALVLGGGEAPVNLHVLIGLLCVRFVIELPGEKFKF